MLNFAAVIFDMDGIITKTATSPNTNRDSKIILRVPVLKPSFILCPPKSNDLFNHTFWFKALPAQSQVKESQRIGCYLSNIYVV